MMSLAMVAAILQIMTTTLPQSLYTGLDIKSTWLVNHDGRPPLDSPGADRRYRGSTRWTATDGGFHAVRIRAEFLLRV